MKEKKSVRTREFQSKLGAYSATATAALLIAPAAEATVQNITSISGGTTISFPTSYGSISDVTLDFTAGPFHGVLFGLNVSSVSAHGGVPAIIGNLACQVTSYGGAAAIRLEKGSGFAGRTFTGGSSNRKNLGTDVSNGGRFFRGSFALPYQTGYVGFKTGDYYGWLKVKVETSTMNHWADKISLVSNGNGIFGAFDKISDTAADNFTVGTAADAVPEPSNEALGGLSLLALGAVWVREMRRRKSPSIKT